MKFGKSIGVQQESRQDLHYVEYKLLKKHIKEVVAHQQDHQLAEALTANTAFEEELAREITKVNACFARNQQELLERTAGLARSQQELVRTEGHTCSGSSSSSSAVALPGPSPTQGREATVCAGADIADPPVCPRPEAFRSLVGILGEVDQLRKYAVWNAMAVVKILKKRRKQSNFGLADTVGERAGWLSRQSFFSGSDFAELHVAIESLGDLMVHSELLPGVSRTPQQKQEAQQCPICLETMSDMVELSCSHRFCWKCFVLGPIAHQPGEYRITQCPICRKETMRTQAELEGASDHAVIGSSSEGLLSRFLHTYFPQEQGSLADGEEGRARAWSEAQKESEQMRDVVGEFVKALMTDIGWQPTLGDAAPGTLATSSSLDDRAVAAAGSSASGAVPSDFFQTLPPPKSQHERQLMCAAQKVAWLQLASTGDPLAMDGATYCCLCSELLFMEAVVMTPCKHHFHKTCIDRIDMPNCPLCQADLPFSWFLGKDHPCVERGFRVVPPSKYQPQFPGGPSKGSRGFPLRRPPPISLLGAGGLSMKSYLHAVVPSGDEEDLDEAPTATPSQPSSPKRKPAADPEVTVADDAASSATESSSDESCSEDGRDDRKRTWVWSAIGKMRMLQHEPPTEAFVQDISFGGVAAGSVTDVSHGSTARAAFAMPPASTGRAEEAAASASAASESGQCSRQVLLIDRYV